MDKKEQTWEFLVTIQGTGKTKDEAWKDAVDSLSDGPGDCPEEDKEIRLPCLG